MKTRIRMHRQMHRIASTAQGAAVECYLISASIVEY